MKYTIEKIATLIGARRIGTAETIICWLLTDSRSLCFPETTLFFALHSERNDGHKYIPELYNRGVRNFVVRHLPEELSAYADANFLKVTNVLAALQRLAERHRDEFCVPVVGITGSNGKTMVKEWLSHVLSPDMTVTRSPRSYNSQIGVPLSVWLLNENTEVALLEAGISEVGEMDALQSIIQPTIGVLTSLGAPHQENFRSLEEKCMEKIQLFKNASFVAYNTDDAIISRCMRRSGFKSVKLGWSRENPDEALYIKDVWTEGDVTTIIYIYKGSEGRYQLPFIDDASIECSLACAVVALHLGVTQEHLAHRMATLEPVAMRLEVKEGVRGCTLINDSYNSDINSLDIALDFMSRRPDQNGRRRTLILSDIYQSGDAPADLYAKVSMMSRSRGVQKFIGIGKQLYANQASIDIAEKYFFTDVKSFVDSQFFRDLHDEVILVKGSRTFGFDYIAELLEQKVHETILEVNLNALINNFNYHRSLLKSDTKLVCMVKADAYGAGAVEVAKTLQDHRVDYLAVAVADEGVTLRKNGITCNIIVMNPEMTAFKTMFDYDLEPEVYSFRLMDALVKAAEKEGITNYPVHVKLDTGMHRLGFNPTDEIDEVIKRLKRQNAIIPRSVFSHFVGSDSSCFDDFSARQFELFDAASRKLQTAYSHKILRHIANSAAIEHFPERQLDMCRLGIGLYCPVDYDFYAIQNISQDKEHGTPLWEGLGGGLVPVSTLKTTILQLRHVPKDDTVGYSRRGTLERDSVIAAIPIGYADGLNRRLGNGRGYCIVNGCKAPYVGNICMDVAMIDVTDIDCKEGDMVEIFGSQLPVAEIASQLETIPYEILTSVSNRVKKVYMME